jgi:D-alanyl-D-alanine carboxypeptidase
MKKKLLLIILLVLIICIVLGLLFYKKSIKLEYKDSISINIGDKIPSIKDYTDNKKVSKIKWKDLIIEDNTCFYSGTYTGTFTYRKDEYKVLLKVIDDEEPTIEIEDITTDYGKEVDIKSKVKTKDNSKDEITISIEGDYNFKKTGTYKLKVIAKDKSNNTSSKEFKLTVKEKPVEQTSNTSNNTSNSPKTGTTSKGFSIVKKNGIYYIGGLLIANKTYALPSTYNPGGLTSDFNNAFSKLKSAASKDGVNLRIISGYRSYNTQVNTYNGWVSKYGKSEADKISARPGHSEHQSGLAADINSLDQSWGNTKEGKWLTNNCSKYGFIIRYPKGKESQTGYSYEPWHIRYVGTDVSSKLYNNGNWITLEEYLGITSKY